MSRYTRFDTRPVNIPPAGLRRRRNALVIPPNYRRDNPAAAENLVPVIGPDGVEYQLPPWAAQMLDEQLQAMKREKDQHPVSAESDMVTIATSEDGDSITVPRRAHQDAPAVARANGWTIAKARALLSQIARNDTEDDQTTIEFMKRQGYGNPSPSAKRDQAPKRDAADVDPTTVEFMRKQGY